MQQRKTSYSHSVQLNRLLKGSFLFTLILLLSSVAACTQVPFQENSSPTTPTLPPITCKTPAHETGESIGTLLSGGQERSFLIRLPSSYGRQPQPLVLAYHGYSWTAKSMLTNTHLEIQAQESGFVLVLPQGLETPPTWNAGIGAYGPTGSADDIQFTRDLLHFLTQNYCIDAQRIYVTGFSLGGGMAYRIACELSDQVAAFATVAGAYYPIESGCQPTRPVPLLEMHGDGDQNAPYNGNPSRLMASVDDFLKVWLELDGCNGSSEIFYQQGEITATRWTPCTGKTEVEHYRIAGGKHDWPLTPEFNANSVIWDFFNRHPLQ